MATQFDGALERWREERRTTWSRAAQRVTPTPEIDDDDSDSDPYAEAWEAEQAKTIPPTVADTDEDAPPEFMSYTAYDPGTVERIAFAEDCPFDCLTAEDHLEHLAALPAPSCDFGALPRLPETHPVAEDMATLTRLLGQQEWRAASFIGGAALEAALVLILEPREDEVRTFADGMRRSGRKDEGSTWSRPFRKWGLYALVLTAAGLGILDPTETALCHRARLARNAMHALGGVAGRREASEVADAVLCVTRKLFQGGPVAVLPRRCPGRP